MITSIPSLFRRLLRISPPTSPPGETVPVRGSRFTRWRLDSEHAAQIAASTEILRWMAAQLSDISTDIRHSVDDVCLGFRGMADKATQTVAIASELIGNAGDAASKDGSAESVTPDTGSAPSSTVDGNLAQIHGALARIEYIARSAKLVALNGSIEATRAGSNGAAFNVVAEETKHLAAHAAHASDDIRGSLECMRQQISSAMSRTEQISHSLTSDIGRSTQAMQFQDRVNQRIEHLAAALLTLSNRLEPPSHSVSGTARQRCLDQWFEEISGTHTMEAERLDAAGRHSRTAGPSHGSAGSVELF